MDNPKLELKLRPVAPTPEPSNEVSAEVSDHSTSTRTYVHPDGVLWNDVRHAHDHCNVGCHGKMVIVLPDCCDDDVLHSTMRAGSILEDAELFWRLFRDRDVLARP